MREVFVLKLTVPLLSLLFYLQLTVQCLAQDNGPSIAELKKMSVDELMNIEVTSVSRRKEKLSVVASAIQVITQEDIARSGAANLPEALRLAPNLQTAQLNSYSWIISARGFNNIFSNKLLVMIDGRTVYSPLFAGVFWDAQQVLLENIDRIEVISGPGGTLWGSNAVNGVINIITKQAAETQGVYASVAAGSFLEKHAAIRYGGKIGNEIFYRLSVQHAGRNNTQRQDGTDNADEWSASHANLRIDWQPAEKDAISLQSNFYLGTEHTDEGAPTQIPSTFDGQNVLAKWKHFFSAESGLSLQLYFDRTWRRDPPSTISDELDTYDLDFQHRFSAGKINNVLWGVGYRFMNDKSQNSTPFVGFVPATRDMDLVSGFIQDEILIQQSLRLTVGTKILHNVYSGVEIQPSVRIGWSKNENYTLWAAVSRAVRTPSRIDVDYRLPTYEVPPGTPHVAGGPNFVSEKVIAYEVGYRSQPVPGLSLSIAAFFNSYDDLYSVEAAPGTVRYEIQNGTVGESYGAELSAAVRVFHPAQIRAGYTYFHKDIWNKPGHSFDTSYAGSDPDNQFFLQIIADLPANFQLDFIGRYVDELPASPVANLPEVSAYFNFDVRLARAIGNFEISFTGRNLAHKNINEYGTATVPQNIYGKLVYRL
ncbi:MAG TPA: TonB-dependent receptor plug domain-containing protein [Cyclobacteriaceae bacterium]|nr:TonB-dependent receptor plug domain-containing protein [Cyclobacteriaceae bacterium]